MILLFQQVIFGFHVNFRGCKGVGFASFVLRSLKKNENIPQVSTLPVTSTHRVGKMVQ